jgi:hypothetical protein
VLYRVKFIHQQSDGRSEAVDLTLESVDYHVFAAWFFATVYTASLVVMLDGGRLRAKALVLTPVVQKGIEVERQILLL